MGEYSGFADDQGKTGAKLEWEGTVSSFAPGKNVLSGVAYLSACKDIGPSMREIFLGTWLI